MSTSIENWKFFKKPFVLPQTCIPFHKCKWEVFATGKAGCVLCGNIHACSSSSNCPLIEIEDGYVCSLTGVVTYARRLEDREFHTTCAMISESYHESNNDMKTVEIEPILHEILLSDKAKKAFLLRVQKEYSRFCQEFSLLVKNDQHPIDALAQVLKTESRKTLKFCRQSRRKLLRKCIQPILKVWKFCEKFVKRNADLRSYVFGLLYIMKRGLVVQNVPFIPRFDELNEILPNETHLSKCFNFKSRLLTDTENRVKYFLRVEQNSNKIY